MKIIYKRCSTNEDKQDVGRQLFGMECDREYIEYASGKNEEDRPVFQEMINSLEKGDEVYFQDLSRAGRNTVQLLMTVNKLVDMGVTVNFKTESLSFTGDEDADPMKRAISEMMLTMLSSVNQMFLAQTKSAVKQGLRKVKATAPEKLAKGKDSKWYKTFKRNQAAGKHATTRNTEKAQKAKEPVIRKVKQIIKYGEDRLTLEQITKHVNNSGLRTPKNLEWTAPGISRLIKQNNITYRKKSCKPLDK